MDLEQHLRAALAPRSAGAGLRQAVLVRLSATSPLSIRARAGKRGIVIVGLLVTIAAAAMTRSLWWPAPETSSAIPMTAYPSAQGAVQESRTPDFSPTPGSSSDTGATIAPGNPPTGAGSALTTNAPGDSAPRLVLQLLTAEESTRETIQRNAASGDVRAAEARRTHDHLLRQPSIRTVLDAFHAAVLEELHAIPDLLVVDGESAEFPHTGTPSFRLSMASLSVAQEQRTEDQPGIIFSMQATRVPETESAPSAMAAIRINLKDACTSTASTWPPCQDAKVAAANLVFQMSVQGLFPEGMSPRSRPLPPAVSATERRTQVREMDAQFNETMARMNEFYRTPEMGEDFLRQAAVADVEERGRLWKVIRGTGHTALIEPLLTSAMNDPDAVRIEAVATLVADFSGDSRVRAALATLALDDPRPVVRGLAFRGLEGEDAWIAFIVAAMTDANLTPVQRAEAFAYHHNALTPGLRREPFKPFSVDQVRTFALLLPQVVNDLPADTGPGSSLIRMTGRAVREDVAATDGLLQLLNPQQPLPIRKAASEMLMEAGRSQRHVLQAVVEVLEKDADPLLREWGMQGRQALAGRP